MNINVAVRKLHPDAVIPVYAKPGDAGFDFVAVEDVIIEPGQTVMVRTGLAFGIPNGFEIQVRPRSGLSAKTPLRVANAPGTVDSGYRGEVKILLQNTANLRWEYLDEEETMSGVPCVEIEETHFLRRTNEECYSHDGAMTPEETYIIRKGDRIAQGVLAEVPTAVFKEMEVLGETERGESGFGSTGASI